LKVLHEYINNRNNNFNLIRVLAAIGVLISHSYALILPNQPEPLYSQTGFTLGQICVHIFFFTSGFLVTGSILHRRKISEFLLSRFLRIYPGLWMMLIIIVFGLGLNISSLSHWEYLQSNITWKYFYKNAIVLTGIKTNLPGVFENNIYPIAVNGSLWTLQAELKLYIALAISFLLCGLLFKKHDYFKFIILGISGLSTISVLINHFYTFTDKPDLLFISLFFTGASFYVLNQHIFLKFYLLPISAILLFASIAIGSSVFFMLYVIGLPWLIIYCAYWPNHFLQKFNAFGDYSYGIYIYAFPIQQTIVMLKPTVSIVEMIIFGSSITILLSILSWHFVEKKCLSLKPIRK
jgi:peptidoglycan/LPS O-acetylase OafA/YrhL